MVPYVLMIFILSLLFNSCLGLNNGKHKQKAKILDKDSLPIVTSLISSFDEYDLSKLRYIKNNVIKMNSFYLTDPSCDQEQMSKFLSNLLSAFKSVVSHKIPKALMDFDFLVHLKQNKVDISNTISKLTFLSGFMTQMIEDTYDTIDTKSDLCVTSKQLAEAETFLAISTVSSILHSFLDSIPLASTILGVFDIITETISQIVAISELKEHQKLTVLKLLVLQGKSKMKTLNTMVGAFSLTDNDVKMLSCEVKIPSDKLFEFMKSEKIVHDETSRGLCDYGEMIKTENSESVECKIIKTKCYFTPDQVSRSSVTIKDKCGKLNILPKNLKYDGISISTNSYGFIYEFTKDKKLCCRRTEFSKYKYDFCGTIGSTG